MDCSKDKRETRTPGNEMIVTLDRDGIRVRPIALTEGTGKVSARNADGKNSPEAT